MDPETEEIIKKQMKILPIEVRTLLADPGLKDKILNIGKKNGLNVEQLGTFQLETNLVLLGLVHPDIYPDELKNRLKANEMKVDNIINDVKREILNGVREKLIETFDEESEIEFDWRQNLDFIFSGGDYSDSTDKKDSQIPVIPETNKTTALAIVPPTLEDIKANVQKTNTPNSAPRMTDMRSKLVT